MIMHPLAVQVLLEDFHGSLVVLVFDHLADFDVVQVREESALTLSLPLGEVQVGHGAGEAIGAVGHAGFPHALIGDPRVFETLVNGDAFVDIDGQHAVDQVQGRVADAVPVRGWVVELTHLDLLGKSIGAVSGVELVAKGWESAKTDVQDYAQRPDVYGSSVLPMTAVL